MLLILLDIRIKHGSISRGLGARDTTIYADSFYFRFGFSQLITSVSGWNLCFSSTLHFLIEYLSCNDDLVSKIRDHFPKVNYLKSPNW